MTRAALTALLAALLAASARAETLYEGEIVPRDFMPLHAPVNSLRLPHWGSTSNSIQLQELPAEETLVKAGDTVGSFKFGNDRAHEWLEEKAKQLESSRDEELVAADKRIQELQNELARVRLEREKLRMDMLRTESLSKVKAQLLKYDFDLKTVDAEAAQQRLEAAKIERDRDAGLHEVRIKTWKTQFGVFDETKARYTVKAPVAGRLFYPMLPQQNRKVRKGDDMNSGTHFLSVVQSDRAQVRFFVPEADVARVRTGDRVQVAPDGAAPYAATVSTVDFFPQFVGDARRNFRLPNAWEKCYVVLADVDADFSKIAKKEVRVTPAR